jgi:hypothetical protein
MIEGVLMSVLVLAAATGDVYAIDHTNLDEGRPLRLEDAYAIADGEIATEVGGGFTLQRRGSKQGVFPAEILYGAYPNLQVGVGTTLATDPRNIDDRPKSGDLQLSALYNLNQQTISLPAFALKVGVDTPTGVGARGYGVELKGIITKSIERLSLHLSAGYEFLIATSPGDRDGRYQLHWARVIRSAPRNSPGLRWWATSSPSSPRGAASRLSSELRLAYDTS